MLAHLDVVDQFDGQVELVDIEFEDFPGGEAEVDKLEAEFAEIPPLLLLAPVVLYSALSASPSPASVDSSNFRAI